MMRLHQPWSLWLLVFLPLVLLRLRGLTGASVLRRTAAWLCLAFALAGPEMLWGATPGAVMLVLDLSASTSRSLKEGIDRAREYVRALPAGASVGIVGFAGEAHLLQPLRAGASAAEVSTVLERALQAPEERLGPVAREETDIAAGLRLAGWALPSDRRGRVLLLTDGWETRGDARRAVRDLAPRGVAVDTLTLVPPPALDAAIDELDAPARVPLGLQFEIRAAIRSTSTAPATLVLSRDGVPLARQAVHLIAGRTEARFAAAADTAGSHRYGIRVATAGDTEPRNDSAEAAIMIADRPRILWVGPGETAPRESGWDLTVIGSNHPGASPRLDEFDAVVLADVVADALPEGLAAQVPAYVGRFGGGLLMLGGRHAFAPGGYRGTPVEDVLPVKLTPPDSGKRPGLALVIALDKSGSMAEALGTTSKIQAAREAVLTAAELLEPGDRLGVLAFDGTPRWSLPVQVTPARGQLHSVLDQLRPGGGTRILPALAEAAAQLRDLSGWRRHIVLVTDGQGEGGDFAGSARRLAAAQISVSAVAVGDDADVALLRGLALAGGGRLELAHDAGKLAAAFRREIVSARGTVIREERTAVLATPHPVLGPTGSQAVPPLYGFIATTAKPLAAVPLRTQTGEPILALAPFGLGRAAALTTDLHGPWGADWRRWEETPRLLAQVLGWLLRTPAAETLSVRQEAAGEGWQLTVRATSPDGAFVDGRAFSAHLEGAPGGATTLSLEQTGPGAYAKRLPSRIVQPTRVVLEDRTGGEARIALRTQIGGSYSEEYRIREPNQALLEEIRRISGGQSLDTGGSAPVVQAVDSEWVPVWPGLAWGGLGLFLLDLLLGRLRGSRRGTAGRHLSSRLFARGWLVKRMGRGRQEPPCIPS
jgi:Ca-activated chloride channel homolog